MLFFEENFFYSCLIFNRFISLSEVHLKCNLYPFLLGLFIFYLIYLIQSEISFHLDGEESIKLICFLFPLLFLLILISLYCLSLYSPIFLSFFFPFYFVGLMSSLGCHVGLGTHSISKV